MKMILLATMAAATITATACGVDPAINRQKENVNKAMLEHNDVSLELQKTWGSKPRSETDTQAQRAWEQQMSKDCNPEATEAHKQIGEDLNVIYCEVNKMRERIEQLK